MISFGIWIAGLFGKTLINTKTAKRLGVAVAVPLIVIGLLLLLWIGRGLYDRGVVKQHEDQQKAQVAHDTLKADREANHNAQQRAEVAEAENARLENAMVEAQDKDPEKGKREVGPVTQSYFDNLPKKRR